MLLLYSFDSCLFHLDTFLHFLRSASRPLLRDLEGVELGAEFVFIGYGILALSLVFLSLISFFKLPSILVLELIDPLLNDLELARGGFSDARYFRGPIRHYLVVGKSCVVWWLNNKVRMRVVISGAVGNEILIDEDGIGLIVFGLHSQLI